MAARRLSRLLGGLSPKRGQAPSHLQSVVRPLMPNVRTQWLQVSCGEGSVLAAPGSRGSRGLSAAGE